jgi:hypothetical protein
MADSELVVVGTFLSQFEADLARSALEAAGIDAMVRSDDCGGMRPHLWMSGVQLLVRTEDAAYASELIEAQSAAPDENSD